MLLSAGADAREHTVSVDAIALSVASYLSEPAGPRPRRRGRTSSAYSEMPDLRTAGWNAKLEALFGPCLSVEILHDGTAAASSWAPPSGSVSATLTLGTYLAVGFPA